MRKLRPHAFIVGMAILGLLLFGMSAGAQPPQSAHAASVTVRLWLQTMDSCQQAIPGASYTLSDKITSVKAGPGAGTKPRTVASANGHCPLQRGNCQAVPTGCVYWDVLVPLLKTKTYTITETQVPSGYVYCLGGSDCAHGANIIKVAIDKHGHVTATDENFYPNGSTIVFPTNGTYAATQTDPIVVHNSHLGTGSCDGDGDADDHVTGSEGLHAVCDSDSDK